MTAVITIQPVVPLWVRSRLRDLAEHPDDVLRDILVRQSSNRVRECVFDPCDAGSGDVPHDAAYLLTCPRPLSPPCPVSPRSIATK